MVRKCNRGIAEIAVMEVAKVGVRTRARAALDTTSSGAAKRRKVNAGELVKLSSPYNVQLRSRRRVVNTASDKNLGLPTTSSAESNIIGRRRTTLEEECSSPSSSDRCQVSCCSSNGSSELAEDRIKFVDLVEDGSAEVETSTCNSCRESRREMTPSSELRAESDNGESNARPNVWNSDSGRSVVGKMPTELELEEFFSTAEKDIQKQFAKKYNYDIAKDVPLEGRYEWIRLKP